MSRGEQGRRDQPDLTQAMCIRSTRCDAMNVRTLGRCGSQLAAESIGRHPLIMESVGRGRRAVGSQEVHQTEREERTLSETRLERRGGLGTGHALEENGVGK